MPKCQNVYLYKRLFINNPTYFFVNTMADSQLKLPAFYNEKIIVRNHRGEKSIITRRIDAMNFANQGKSQITHNYNWEDNDESPIRTAFPVSTYPVPPVTKPPVNFPPPVHDPCKENDLRRSLDIYIKPK